MTLALFLVDQLPGGPDVELEGPEGHHAADVARLRVGEGLLLGDGRGGTASAVVRSVGRGRLTATIESRGYQAPPDPRLVVLQGIAKGDRGELAVQAMTEVGVDRIVPWPAARSVAVWRDGKHLARWRSTAREAAKQARRAWVPDVSEPVANPVGVSFVLHEEATARLSTVDLPAVGDIVLAVGPEGGITEAELDAFTAAGAVPVRLGDTVLRTSTAGVAALAVLATRLGRW